MVMSYTFLKVKEFLKQSKKKKKHRKYEKQFTCQKIELRILISNQTKLSKKIKIVSN